MSYYSDYYVPTINKYGTDIYERLQGLRDKGFKLFLERTPNKVSFTYDESEYLGAVEDKITNETELTSYLLVEKSLDLESGVIIPVTSLSDNSVRNYLIIAEEKHNSGGYRRYIVVLVDKELDWILDGLVYNTAAHLITGKDRKILSNFAMINEVAVDQLKENRLLLLAATDNIKEGVRLLLGKKSWIISGIDDISVPNIYFMTIARDFKDEEYDRTIADEQLLDRWNITSAFGNYIQLASNGNGVDPDFQSFYNNEKKDAELKVEVSNSQITKYQNGKFIPIGLGVTTCTVSLKNNSEVSQTFTIGVIDTDSSFGLAGPRKFSVLAAATYDIINTGNYENLTFSSLNGYFVVNSIVDGKLSITGTKMGEDQILVKTNGQMLYSLPIEIRSAWMMG